MREKTLKQDFFFFFFELALEVFGAWTMSLPHGCLDLFEVVSTSLNCKTINHKSPFQLLLITKMGARSNSTNLGRE